MADLDDKKSFILLKYGTLSDRWEDWGEELKPYPETAIKRWLLRCVMDVKDIANLSSPSARNFVESVLAGEPQKEIKEKWKLYGRDKSSLIHIMCAVAAFYHYWDDNRPNTIFHCVAAHMKNAKHGDMHGVEYYQDDIFAEKMSIYKKWLLEEMCKEDF